jgi:hypothetical protein
MFGGGAKDLNRLLPLAVAPTRLLQLLEERRDVAFVRRVSVLPSGADIVGPMWRYQTPRCRPRHVRCWGQTGSDPTAVKRRE